VRLLVTGGAGFVGSSLALAFKAEDEGADVVAFDNLRRRGSERNLSRLSAAGVDFVHGDVRQPDDLAQLTGTFDWMIDAAAEPSALAGLEGSPAAVIGPNLVGTLHCLEFCRRRVGRLLFLSTSRVYSIAPLRRLALREGATRFELEETQSAPGVTVHGVSEEFPTHLPRSYYGASKLASELLIQEYAENAGLDAVVDRCGVIAGPGQFGRVDQGVFSLWVARHVTGGRLRYTGFGGSGRQVRDLLHPADLFDLLKRQMASAATHRGEVFNVGGGPEVSASLREFTAICREVTGRKIDPEARADSHPVDVPWYVSDPRRASRAFDWTPKRGVRAIVADLFEWLREGGPELHRLFA
jgi:CDP-paratose 2-epimerase